MPQLSTYFNEDSQEKLTLLMEYLEQDPTVMGTLHFDSRSGVVNLLINSMVPLMLQSFKMGRDWPTLLKLFQTVATNEKTPELEAMEKLTSRVNRTTQTTDKSYYLLLYLAKSLTNDAPEEIEKIKSTLTNDTDENKIDSYLHNLIGKDINSLKQRNQKGK